MKRNFIWLGTIKSLWQRRPQLPPIPSIGGLDKKERKKLKGIKISTIHCTCGEKYQRQFEVGDYLYKNLDVPCPKCGKLETSVVEVFQDYVTRVNYSKVVEKLKRKRKFGD